MTTGTGSPCAASPSFRTTPGTSLWLAVRSSRPTKNWNRCGESWPTSCRSRWCWPASAGGSWPASSLSPVVGDGRTCEADERREPERTPAGRERRATSSAGWPRRSTISSAASKRRSTHAAPVHGGRLARIAHAGGHNAHRGERRVAAAAPRREPSIATPSPSSSSRRRRLSRIVDDLFTLARADAGTYPVRRTPMYLDEVVDDVVKAARVLASTQDVSIEAVTIRSRVDHRR